MKKALKAFIKPFEAPQRSVKVKIQVSFLSSSIILQNFKDHQHFVKKTVEKDLKLHIA